MRKNYYTQIKNEKTCWIREYFQFVLQQNLINKTKGSTFLNWNFYDP
jgi:5'(3')-deoxyribonucleotidase